MLLKAFEASINNNPQSPTLLSSKRSLTACIAPSMPNQMPAHNWSDPQITLASDRVTRHIVLLMILRRVSPMPIGLIPGDLSVAISQLETNALIVSHGMMLFS